MFLNTKKIGLIHCVGIGGIGISGIAEILHSLGFQVQGSDKKDGANVERLRKKGIAVFIGHQANNLKNVKIVVASSAVHENNPEIIEARCQKIPVLKRHEMLAELVRLKPTIAVSGAHGKTTTTSLGATVLQSAGYDPTIISGGVINALGTNAVLGAGDWTIVEADESDGTFCKLPAQISIVTNIAPEHLEHYGSFAKLKEVFLEYLQNLPFYGLAILCADNKETLLISSQIVDRRVLTYGLGKVADMRAIEEKWENGRQTFSLLLSRKAREVLQMTPFDQERYEDFSIPMAGKHNLQNALAVVVASLEVGLTIDQIREGLRSFAGVNRRFTHLGLRDGVDIIDDYAHHPEEIGATLQAARDVCKGKVIAVMQPHRYSRLKNLYREFVESLSDFDKLVVTPVYSAGENPEPGIDHLSLVDSIGAKNPMIIAANNTDDVISYLNREAKPGDMAVFMGAGDITNWAHTIAKSTF